jgi:hypothetical protein
MPNRRGRITLNLLISTAVLVWTTMPPAIVHSHRDGDDPAHRHEVGTTHHDLHHHHDLAHASDHVHARPAALDFVESGTPAVHCHWQLLGFWFALPFSGERNDGEDERGMAKVAIVDVADGDGLASPTGIALAQAVCEPCPAASPGLVPLASTLQGPQRQMSSTPLCDSARLERSGVLLA